MRRRVHLIALGAALAVVALPLAAADPAQQKHNKLFLGHVVRMQEEIGTGGAGFRFLYAAFLQEASVVMQQPVLSEIAQQLTAAGDQWRQFALRCARMSCVAAQPAKAAVSAMSCVSRSRSNDARISRFIAP